MAEYKIGIRFPIKVLKKAPFVYSGPDFRSFTLGAVSDVAVHRDLQFQRLYPFTLSKVERGRSIDLLFCFTFLFIDDGDERGVFITHPCLLTDDELTEALEALLDEVERSAKFSKSRFIEIEINEEALGHVAYPTSSSFLSFELDEAKLPNLDPNFFTERGFNRGRELRSYENDVEDFLKTEGKLADDYASTPLTPREFEEVKGRANGFKARSFEISHRDEGLKRLEVPYFEDTLFLVSERHGRSLFKKTAEGYLRWLPNIFEASSAGGTPHVNIFPHLLERVKYMKGKIFDWGISALDRRLFVSLLAHAAGSMSRRGMGTFEFARVDGAQTFVADVLEEIGFRRVHAMKLLRKELG